MLCYVLLVLSSDSFGSTRSITCVITQLCINLVFLVISIVVGCVSIIKVRIVIKVKNVHDLHFQSSGISIIFLFSIRVFNSFGWMNFKELWSSLNCLNNLYMRLRLHFIVLGALWISILAFFLNFLGKISWLKSDLVFACLSLST